MKEKTSCLKEENIRNMAVNAEYTPYKWTENLRQQKDAKNTMDRTCQQRRSFRGNRNKMAISI